MCLVLHCICFVFSASDTDCSSGTEDETVTEDETQSEPESPAPQGSGTSHLRTAWTSQQLRLVLFI